MHSIHFTILSLGLAMFVSAAVIAIHDVVCAARVVEGRSVAWRTSLALVMMVWVPILVMISMAAAPAKTGHRTAPNVVLSGRP